jgi:serine/threonine-protein kinase
MLLTLGGSRSVQPIVKTPFAERNAVTSRDGRWLAYESNENEGQYQVFVRPFPDVSGGRWQVSTVEGTRPVWARDGRELFFVQGDSLMSVSVGSGPAWTADVPVKVLDLSGYYQGNGNNWAPTYDVSLDGRRFLMLKEDQTAVSAGPAFVVVLNWFEELKRLVPTK